MAKVTLSGDILQDYQTRRRLLHVNGNIIEDYQTRRRLLQVNGNIIEDYQTGRRLLQVKGNIIQDYQTSHSIATVDDVKKAIQGATGTMTDVALWWVLNHHKA